MRDFISLAKDLIVCGENECSYCIFEAPTLLFMRLYRDSCDVVCLDGSPPAYHFDKGFGTGVNNWLVHIEVCPHVLEIEDAR